MLAVMAVKQWVRKASAPVDTPGLEDPPLPKPSMAGRETWNCKDDNAKEHTSGHASHL
jgi:hypothetical protein